MTPSSPTREGALPARGRIRIEVAWTLAGNIAYAASQWFILLAVTRIGSPEAVGRLSLAIAVCAPVFMFLSLQLGVIQATHGPSNYRFGEYLGLRVICSVLAVVLSCAIAAVGWGDPAFLAVTLGVAGWKFWDGIAEIPASHLQRRGQMKEAAICLSTRGVVSACVLAGVYWFTSSLPMAAGLSAVARALVFWFVDRTALYRGDPSLEGSPRFNKTLLRVAVASLPLGVSTLAISLYPNVPRYVLSAFRGEGAVGIYSVVGSFLAVGTVVVQALTRVAAPRFSRGLNAGNLDQVWSLLFKMSGAAAAVGAAACLFALIFGKYLLGVVYGEQYGDYAVLLAILLVGATFGQVTAVIRSCLTAMRAYFVQAVSLGLVVVVTAIVCVVLIPPLGLMGAGVGFALGGFVGLLVAAASLGYLLKEQTRRMERSGSSVGSGV